MKELFECYKGKTVLVTGHTGFKGSWLCIWLLKLGANVIGYALDPNTSEDNFVVTGLSEKMVDIRGDIRNSKKLQKVFDKYQPEIVFHLAAQALVGESYTNPIYTYEVNVMGTIHVLECIRNTKSVKVGIFITTDKCYENQDQSWAYKESDQLGGYDPYSSSKAADEIIISSWRRSFLNPNNYNEHKQAIATVRAGNVIGGGDWSKNRIIPDCIRSLENNQAIKIRNPYAIRPWQHVLDPLNGYLKLGEQMLSNPIEYSGSWNFGPYLNSIITVKDLVKLVIKHYEKGEFIEYNEDKEFHESTLLNLDISKSYLKLRWKPTWNIDDAVKYTMQWYISLDNKDKYNLCIQQIEQFCK